MMNINLVELSKWAGKSEVEIAKAIITLLAMKADVSGIPQEVELTCRKIEEVR